MRTLICCLLVLLTAACGASGPPRTLAPALTPPQITTAVAPIIATTAPPQPTPAPISPVPVGLIFAQVQYPAPGIRVIDTHGNAAPRMLPAGVPAPDWSTLYTASYDGTHTQVAALDPLTGAVLRTTFLDQVYQFRTTSLAQSYQFQWDDDDGVTGAGRTSPDGRWLALTGSHEYHADGRVLSRFAVLDTAFTQSPRTLVLNGTYSFDAIANDGQTLYLIEHLPVEQVTATPAPGTSAPPRYRVVLVDLLHPTDTPQVLIDKTTQGAVMAGTRQSAVVMPDGQWLFSLYLNPKQPFIHALDLTHHFAVCIFLPAATGDLASQGHWALTRTPDAKRLYAANSTTGTVVEIDAASLSTLRTVHLTPDAPHAANPLAAVAAWFAPWHVAAKGDRMATGIAVTPDGSTLVMSGGQGLTFVDTRDLQVRTRVLTNQHFGNVLMSADGQRLYAANGDAGTLVVLDPVSGAMRDTIPLGSDLWEITLLRAT